MTKIKITKLKEIENPVHPNNIPEGVEKLINIVGDFKVQPEIGHRFPPLSWWSTSIVQEIIDENTFKTLNSIYKWEIINDK